MIKSLISAGSRPVMVGEKLLSMCPGDPVYCPVRTTLCKHQDNRMSDH